MQNYQPTELLENSKENKLSIYERGKVSAESFALGTKLIKGSKPELPDPWYEVLEVMLDQNGFTDQRFKDAVAVMISTCPYPKPSHAEILSYDKLIDVYTWDELLKNVKDAAPDFRKKYLENFVRIIHYSEERWVKKEDAIKYKLELWKKPICIFEIEESTPSEIENENVGNLSTDFLVKSFQMPAPKKERKIFSREERELRKKQFDEIVKEEELKNKVEAE